MKRSPVDPDPMQGELFEIASVVPAQRSTDEIVAAIGQAAGRQPSTEYVPPEAFDAAAEELVDKSVRGAADARTQVRQTHTPAPRWMNPDPVRHRQRAEAARRYLWEEHGLKPTNNRTR